LVHKDKDKEKWKQKALFSIFATFGQ